jgi:hypothetical protein
VRVNETLAAATEAAFGSEADDAMAVLMAYGEEPQDREPDWVRRAILTLATGDLSRLRHFAERAHQDYRDVLMWAESPRDPDEPQTYAELLERLGLPPDPDHA